MYSDVEFAQCRERQYQRSVISGLMKPSVENQLEFLH